jgi:hypothetical protein
MRDESSVDGRERVWITEKGRYDLIFGIDCQCDPKLFGLLVRCPACGTVYGHLSELTQRRGSRRPPMIRW